MVCEGNDAEKDLNGAMKRIFNLEEDTESEKPKVLWSSFFNQVSCNSFTMILWENYWFD